MTTASSKAALFPILARQLTLLRESCLDTMLNRHAIANGLPPALLYAIASRETGCRNELGDKRDDGFHGVGLMQIDIENAVAKDARDSGSWQRDPEGLIAFAAAMLCGNLVRAQRACPRTTLPLQMKVAAAGYNCGMGRALEDQEQHGDCDLHTEHSNYGADVMARMEVFEELIAQGPNEPAKAA